MPLKRKGPALGLERRVRARREDEWEAEPDSADEEMSENEEGSEEDVDGENSGDDESASGADPDGDSESAESEPDATPKVDFASVSFGALARAQASLPPTKRKSKTAITATPDEPQSDPAPRFPDFRAESKPKPPPKRSSKHAPQEQTSKKPVSRRREILPETRRPSRDPRFDPLAGPLDEAKARKAYAFLDEYRESEMADLRAQIKKTRNEAHKEDLKRQLHSMESKKKAQSKKDESDRVLEEHRKKEKELVAQGKTPFYLKKSEQKKKVLVDRFAGMSKGQVDRAIERKRKKVAGKEKKQLDFLQRDRSHY